MMMTPEQCNALKMREAVLLSEWHTRWQEQHSTYQWFNEDGIVDYKRWFALPDGKHILVLLKETNGLQNSLTDFLRHGGSQTYWRTWNNVARWTNLVLNGTYWEFVSRAELDDMVRNIAVVNLKKYAGGARANRKEILSAASKDIDLLKRQIMLYEPDIILTGGWNLVSDFLHDTIFQDTAVWSQPNDVTQLWYYETDKIIPNDKSRKTLVISMPHPNRAAKRWTIELEKVLRETNRV